MKRLSESLTELAARVSSLESTVEATLEENQASLEKRRGEVENAIDREVKEFESAASEAEVNLRNWWIETKGSIERGVDEIRDDRTERQAKRKVAKARRAAEAAEEDAVAAVALAMYCLNVAEYAVVDAALARANADAIAETT